jgi:LPS-assembly lipoprotein
MPLSRRSFLHIAATLPLAGCALRPLYGTTASSADVAADLAQVQVPEQQTRPGQLVRNQLLTIMQGSNAGTRYTLSLVVAERATGTSTLPDTNTTRYQYKLTGTYKLSQNSDGAQLAAGSIFSAVDYDTVRQPVADLQAKRDAMERASIELAQDIRLRIAAYFSSRKP